jgi:hypothetical protein
MIDKIDVLKRVQSLKNKVDGLEASQERRKQDVQKKRAQIEKEKTFQCKSEIGSKHCKKIQESWSKFSGSHTRRKYRINESS